MILAILAYWINMVKSVGIMQRSEVAIGTTQSIDRCDQDSNNHLQEMVQRDLETEFLAKPKYKVPRSLSRPHNHPWEKWQSAGILAKNGVLL